MATISRHTRKLAPNRTRVASQDAHAPKPKASAEPIKLESVSGEWRNADDSAKASLVSPETVHHPAHYNAGKLEVIAVIEDWKLGFHLGNVVKYIARSAHKGRELEDLKKARWYLDRYISGLTNSK